MQLFQKHQKRIRLTLLKKEKSVGRRRWYSPPPEVCFSYYLFFGDQYFFTRNRDL